MAPRSAEPAMCVTVRELPDDRASDRWDHVLAILIAAGRRQPEVVSR
jgi:hypothetical protein